MSNQRVKQPKFRFSSFGEELNKYNLGELGHIRSGVGFPDKEQGGKEGIPFFKISDMNLAGNEVAMLVANNYVTKNQVEKNGWKIIEETPSLIFAKVGAALMLNRKRLVNRPFLIDNNTMSYSLSNKWDRDFALALFQTIHLPRYAQVGALPSYNASDISTIQVSLPPLEEQSFVGSLFRTIDDLLASYKDNLDNYKSIKKTMLSKMFPKVGQTVPEIRLDGFEGEWEKDIFKNYLTESRILGDSGREAKKITVKLWGKGVVEKDEKYVGSENTQYYIRNAGQFIYSKLDFQNQAFGIVPKELDGYQSTLDLPTFNIGEIDHKFLLEYVMRREFYEYQGLIANGSRKAKRIHPDDFLIMPVILPSLNEQQAIGEYFSNLDNLINSQQEKIIQLETLKKKLLQDMFI